MDIKEFETGKFSDYNVILEWVDDQERGQDEYLRSWKVLTFDENSDIKRKELYDKNILVKIDFSEFSEIVDVI